MQFHIYFKTADSQVIIYTTFGSDITATFDMLFLYVPTFIPDAATQGLFNDSTKSSFTLSFSSWFTDRRVVDTGLEYQPVIGSSQDFDLLKCLIAAHQTAARMVVPNKANNTANFDNLDVRSYFVKIDGFRYPKEVFNVNYAANDLTDQYRDPKLSLNGTLLKIY